jgi:hypothetical protein
MKLDWAIDGTVPLVSGPGTRDSGMTRLPGINADCILKQTERQPFRSAGCAGMASAHVRPLLRQGYRCNSWYYHLALMR